MGGYLAQGAQQGNRKLSPEGELRWLKWKLSLKQGLKLQPALGSLCLLSHRLLELSPEFSNSVGLA